MFATRSREARRRMFRKAVVCGAGIGFIGLGLSLYAKAYGFALLFTVGILFFAYARWEQPFKEDSSVAGDVEGYDGA